jgi:hypothetical protein
MMAEVVAADLSVVVRQTPGECLRLREQQHADVLVGVTREENYLRRLKVLDAIADVGDAGHDPVAVDVNGRDLRTRDDLEMAGCLRTRNGRDRGRILCVDVTPAAITEAVIHAG